MFKLVVLSALIAFAAGKPSGILETKSVEFAHTPIVKSALISEPTSIAVQQPYIAKVGEIVRSEPSAVSSQYQTIVHNRVASVEPILAKGVQTVAAPAVRTFEAPVVAGYAATPVVTKSVIAPAAPIISSYAAAAPIASSYAASAPLFAAPAGHFVNGLGYSAGFPAYKTLATPFAAGTFAHGYGYNAPLLRAY